MKEEISKKDLLKLTGISYGQLYRWKRQGLIPEEWFIKRSSYTGQETYFPKELILARIEKIIELKDQKSLDEIHEILHNQHTMIDYEIQTLKDRELLKYQVLYTILNEDSLRFDTIVLLKLLDLCNLSKVSQSSLSDCYKALEQNKLKIMNEFDTLYFIQFDDEIGFMAFKEESGLMYHMDFVKVIHVQPVIEQVKLSLSIEKEI